MTSSRDIISNLEQTAQHVIDYLLLYKSSDEKQKLREELDNILMLAQKEYAGDSSTTLGLFKQYFIFPFTRKRKNELDQAISSLHGCSEEQFARFIILIDLLKAGGACKSTSLNTLILNKLITATGKYKSLEEDDRLNAKGILSADARENIRDVLKDIIIEKATKIIIDRAEERHKEEQEKLAAKKAQQPKPNRLAIDANLVNELDAILKGKSNKRKSLQDVNKINKNLLAERHAMLKAALGARVTGKKQKPVSNLTEQLIPLKPAVEETVVEVLQPVAVAKKSASVSSNKLQANPAFAASLNTINSFFAQKYKNHDETHDETEEQYEKQWLNANCAV